VGSCKKARERLFTGACSDRTSGNGFKLKAGRVKLNEEIFYDEGGESQE